MTISRFAPAVTALALALLAPLSFAQYVWTDEKGVKQFSDMPPPSNVPKSRILKQPASNAAAEPGGGAAQPSASAADASKGQPTTAERNAEFNKRRLEQVEKEKKAVQEAEKKAALAKNCERARNYRSTLESGQRIANTDKNGERSFMSDEQRAQELRDTQRILADCR